MIKSNSLNRLEELEKRFLEIEKELSDPGLVSEPGRITLLSREHSEISGTVNKFREYKRILKEIEEDEKLVKEEDPVLREAAKDELQELLKREKNLEKELIESLISHDPNENKNVIMEIRAGTGGEEAALFASDLFRMYIKFAERNNWKVEVLNTNPTELGGIKEVIFSVNGSYVYKKLKFESGVHRVQRIPRTEASGRIHTSAATVAVLPEAEEIELQLSPKELRIDTFCASGPGGQGVNTTYSAVRITHIPTGVVVTCQDERSQIKNKERALKVLRSRLLQMKKKDEEEKIAKERRSQVGSGDRSEKIRTYNFPQNRVTDHRVNLSIFELEKVMDGHLEEFVEALITSEREEFI